MSTAVQDDAVFDHDRNDDDSPSQDDDFDDLENDDFLAVEEDDEDLNFISPPTLVTPAPPVAVPSASLVTVAVDLHKFAAEISSSAVLPDAKRQSTEAMMIVPLDERKPQPLDKSRQLFQRLWTDEDEIELLQGFLEYTAHRGGIHYDTAMFYDQIKSKLQLDFNKSQLVEKLRRLKKKYRNVLAKIDSGKDFSFKSPHDQITFEISSKIWSSTGKLAAVEDGNLEEEGNPNLNYNSMNSFGEINQKSTPTPQRKRSRSRSLATPLILGRCGGGGFSVDDGGNLRGKVDDKPVLNHGVASNNGVSNNSHHHHGNVNVGSLIEEAVKSCLSPLFKELLKNKAMVSGGGRGIESLAMLSNFEGVEMMGDEKWRKQQIMELEVYSKRLELVQDQIRSQLEELRSI